jgi:hypothetical protein
MASLSTGSLYTEFLYTKSTTALFTAQAMQSYAYGNYVLFYKDNGEYWFY